MKKTTVIIILIVIMGAFVYFYISGSKLSDDSALLQGSSPDISDNVGAEVLALLNQIQSLKIDPTIFSEPVYKTLIDYSVPIPPQPVGRTNPFAPVR